MSEFLDCIDVGRPTLSVDGPIPLAGLLAYIIRCKPAEYHHPLFLLFGYRCNVTNCLILQLTHLSLNPGTYGQNDLFFLQFMPGILLQEQGEQVRRDGGFLLIRVAREYLFDKVMLKLKGRNEEREPAGAIGWQKRSPGWLQTQGDNKVGVTNERKWNKMRTERQAGVSAFMTTAGN